MKRPWIWKLAIAIAAILSVTPAPARGQQLPLEVTIGAHGGGTIFTEFLEQRISGDEVPVGGEREIVAQTAAMIGGSISFSRWQMTEVRIGADWAGTEIEARDDSGIESDALDQDALADLNVVLGQLSIVRYVMPKDAPVAPYLTLGVNVAVWALDEATGGDLGAIEETQVRYGATAGVGARFAIGQQAGLRIEIDRATVGNPFDGESAFRVSGDTFDEPSTVGMLRLVGGLTYTL